MVDYIVLFGFHFLDNLIQEFMDEGDGGATGKVNEIVYYSLPLSGPIFRCLKLLKHIN